MFIGLVILFFWSFSFQEQKKVNKFKNQLNEAREYNDPLIDEIYIDFLNISNFNITDQDVSIKLVEFPFVFDFVTKGLYHKKIINNIPEKYPALKSLTKKEERVLSKIIHYFKHSHF